MRLLLYIRERRKGYTRVAARALVRLEMEHRRRERLRERARRWEESIAWGRETAK